MVADELEEAVKSLSMYKRATILEMYGPQAALLYMLFKLDVVGMRRVSQGFAASMIVGANTSPPPCSIPCAVVSLSKDYLQFCPKRIADKDLKI